MPTMDGKLLETARRLCVAVTCIDVHPLPVDNLR
jgi:hypothetical protein